MSNLARFEQDGLELVIDTTSGEAFASISAVARMTGKSKSTIHDYVNGQLETVREMTLLEAQLLTTTGFKTVRLLNETQILEVVNKYKPDLLIKFAQAGLRTFLHQLAGYQVSSSAVVPEPPKSLPQRSVIDYVEANKHIETVNNKTLQQLLRDELIDELSVKRGQRALPEPIKQFTIAKVRAKELGYSSKEIGNGSALGKFIARNVPVAFVERVGRYDVKHYEVDDRLDTAIKTFFGMRRAIAA